MYFITSSHPFFILISLPFPFLHDLLLSIPTSFSMLILSYLMLSYVISSSSSPPKHSFFSLLFLPFLFLFLHFLFHFLLSVFSFFPFFSFLSASLSSTYFFLSFSSFRFFSCTCLLISPFLSQFLLLLTTILSSFLFSSFFFSSLLFASFSSLPFSFLLFSCLVFSFLPFSFHLFSSIFFSCLFFSSLLFPSSLLFSTLFSPSPSYHQLSFSSFLSILLEHSLDSVSLFSIEETSMQTLLDIEELGPSIQVRSRH